MVASNKSLHKVPDTGNREKFIANILVDPVLVGSTDNTPRAKKRKIINDQVNFVGEHLQSTIGTEEVQSRPFYSPV
jgi:hypothetical protein